MVVIHKLGHQERKEPKKEHFNRTVRGFLAVDNTDLVCLGSLKSLSAFWSMS